MTHILQSTGLTIVVMFERKFKRRLHMKPLRNGHCFNRARRDSHAEREPRLAPENWIEGQ